MNYQKKTPQEVLDILKQRDIKHYEISYFAWPQAFNNTSGPRNGCGGDSVSYFTVEAYVCNGCGPTVYLCCGMYAFLDETFKPFKNINNWTKIKVDK